MDISQTLGLCKIIKMLENNQIGNRGNNTQTKTNWKMQEFAI